MRSMPYLIQHPSGVFYAQRKVPDRLQVSAARVTKSTRPRLVFLKRSLGTKDRKQANISIKPVLIDFDRIIREAEALEKSKPVPVADLFRLIVWAVVDLFRSRAALEAEILTLRQQIIVLRRTAVPIGNSILLATDIESGDAPALCERSIA
jgi:hypothetical protein